MTQENTALKLRAVEPSDVDFMAECEADVQASQWSDYQAPLSRHQLLQYALTYDADPFQAGQLRLIAENSDGERIGILDFYDISQRDGKAYVGLTVHPSFRGKHLGGQILKVARDFASSRLGLNQILAKVATVNSIASSLFEKEGYRRIAVLPQWHRLGNTYHDFILFSLGLR